MNVESIAIEAPVQQAPQRVLATSGSQIVATVDISAEGKHQGYLQLPHSTHRSAYGKILIPIVVIRNGAGPTVLLTAGNHGDEYEGQIACMKIARQLQCDSISGAIMIIPALNFPAVSAGQRTSPIDAGNLNRSFPGMRNGSPTQQIAHFVESVLLPQVDYVIDLHSGGSSLEFAAPTLVARRARTHDDLNDQMRHVNSFGAPLTYLTQEATGNDTGMMGACVRAGVKHFTTELGGGGSVSIDGVNVGVSGTMRLLHSIGLINGVYRQPACPSTKILERGGLHSDNFVFALEKGIFEPAVELGTEVTAGQVAGHIHFYHAPWRDPQVYHFKQNGMAIARFRSGMVEMGDALFVTAKELNHKPSSHLNPKFVS